MKRLFDSGVLLCICLLLCAAIAYADDLRSNAHKGGTTRSGGSCGAQARGGLTVGTDPFRAGNQVVRDRATGQPLYRVGPHPFHPGWQRIDNYSTEQPLFEVRPDPFNVDQSVIDRR